MGTRNGGQLLRAHFSAHVKRGTGGVWGRVVGDDIADAADDVVRDVVVCVMMCVGWWCVMWWWTGGWSGACAYHMAVPGRVMQKTYHAGK